MCFLPPLDTSKSKNDISKYLSTLTDIVNINTPINCTYELSYESLEDNSFKVVVNKKVNGITDIPVAIKQEVLQFKVYTHLMNLNLTAIQMIHYL